MTSLSLTPTTLYDLRLRHRLHRSAVVLSLPSFSSSSSSFSSHYLSSKSPSILLLPFHTLYRIPHTNTSWTSRPAPRTRHTAAAAVSGGSLLQDAGATTGILAGAYTLVLTFDTLTQRKLIDQKLSRKLVHILSGLLFAISWPIFSTATEARYFASLVPLFNGLRLLIYGLSLATDEGLIQSVTREGKPEELLKGPLYYVLMLMLCALVFWRESPIGVISLAMMCGGDGVADIMGRRFGSIKLPYNQNKSWVGSISMFIFGFLISIGMLYYYSVLGYFNFNWMWAMKKIAFVALVATIVESLPITETIDDNISVPLTSSLAAYLSFHDIIVLF